MSQFFLRHSVFLYLDTYRLKTFIYSVVLHIYIYDCFAALALEVALASDMSGSSAQ